MIPNKSTLYQVLVREVLEFYISNQNEFIVRVENNLVIPSEFQNPQGIIIEFQEWILETCYIKDNKLYFTVVYDINGSPQEFPQEMNITDIIQFFDSNKKLLLHKAFVVRLEEVESYGFKFQEEVLEYIAKNKKDIEKSTKLFKERN